MRFALQLTLVSGVVLSLGVSSTATAQPNVLVADFHTTTSHAIDVVSDDVRSALVPVVTDRGGTVMPRPALTTAERATLPSCATAGAACDLAMARFLRADLVVTGQLREIDGELSLSLEVVGAASGNLLAGRRATAPKLGALATAAASQAGAALDEVFDKRGVLRRSQLPAPPPVVNAPPVAAAAAAPPGNGILHSQKANLFRGVEGVGGTVLVTASEIRFEAHSVNVQSSTESIAIADVVGIEPVNNGFVVANGAVLRLRTGGERRFALEDRETFIRLVRSRMVTR